MTNVLNISTNETQTLPYSIRDAVIIAHAESIGDYRVKHWDIYSDMVCEIKHGLKCGNFTAKR